MAQSCVLVITNKSETVTSRESLFVVLPFSPAESLINWFILLRECKTLNLACGDCLREAQK